MPHLDLILTNITLRVNKTIVIPGISDHVIPLVELSQKPHYINQERRSIPIFRRADWSGLKTHLATDIKHHQQECQSRQPNDLWTSLKSSIKDAESRFIPTRLAKKRDSLPWINPYLDSLIEKRNSLRRRSKQTGRLKPEVRYKQYKRVVQREMRKQHRQYVHQLLSESDDTPSCTNKKFWTYIKHRRGDGNNITAIKADNKLLMDKKSMADALNNQFKSVFSPVEAQTITKSVSPMPPMEKLIVHEDGVLQLLRQLKTNKATGPDELSARVLKEAADIVAGPLCDIINQSLKFSSVPADWKLANVTPIFKKGDRCKPENYRPISLTCIASKIMEHIVTSHLMKYIEGNNLLFPQQHGFRSKLSCETQLVELVADISKHLDDGKEVDACLLDFSKAFDSIKREAIWEILRYYGVPHKIIMAISCICDGSESCVKIENEFSEFFKVNTGVLQGDTLSTILVYCCTKLHPESK